MTHAIFVRETGGAEQLVWEPLALGAPSAGELRVAVRASGVNFIDVYFRTGLYPRPLPYVAGLEGAGVVEEVGAGVSDFAVGDRVAWTSVPGSYATHVNVPARAAIKLPDSVSEDVAAAAMLQGMTAHYLTHAIRETRPGDRAVVHAAAGGVGLLLIQLLKDAGALVMGTCSSDEKEALARGAGADEVVRYADLVDAAKTWSDGRGVDVVYDSVGKTTFESSLACLRPRGWMVLYGNASGTPEPFDVQRLNALGSLNLTRPSLAHFTQTREELEERAGAVLGAAAAGKLDVRIGARFPLEHAADAHRALEGRHTTGKVILETGTGG